MIIALRCSSVLRALLPFLFPPPLCNGLFEARRLGLFGHTPLFIYTTPLPLNISAIPAHIRESLFSASFFSLHGRTGHSCRLELPFSLLFWLWKRTTSLPRTPAHCIFSRVLVCIFSFYSEECSTTIAYCKPPGRLHSGVAQPRSLQLSFSD